MNQKTTAKDFFLYLGILIGLYVSTISFLTLVFQIINKLFPLAGDFTYYNYSIENIENTIRCSVAILIIFFPTFLYTSYIINKDLITHPEKKDIWIKKWMMYLTLFVSGLTTIITLAITVYTFLGAEDLTLRFFLKVFFVLMTAITIFIAILKDFKRTSFKIIKEIKIFITIISIIILSAIAYGIIVIGSPSSQRAKMIDETKINDLRNIQDEIVYTQWQSKGTVPTDLNYLKDPIRDFSVPTDPETKQNYEYTMLSKNSFELCANFKTNFIADGKDTYGASENWNHKAERTCFTRVIDEKLYPVTSQTQKY